MRFFRAVTNLVLPVTLIAAYGDSLYARDAYVDAEIEDGLSILKREAYAEAAVDILRLLQPQARSTNAVNDLHLRDYSESQLVARAWDVAGVSDKCVSSVSAHLRSTRKHF